MKEESKHFEEPTTSNVFLVPSCDVAQLAIIHKHI
jgi:hypothetical protein